MKKELNSELPTDDEIEREAWNKYPKDVQGLISGWEDINENICYEN